MEKYKELFEYIKNSDSILIISHVNPDGDTLGAMLGLGVAVEQSFKKPVDMLTLGKVPGIYSFLPSLKSTKTLESLDPKKIYDLVISVDVASKERMMNALKIFQNAKMSVNIDHHKTNDCFGKLNIVDGAASSAGEMVFRFLKSQNIELTKEIATCLYTAVFTDTGGFRFENTNEKVFEMAKELVAQNISPHEIARACYDSKPMAMVLMQAYCVSNAEFFEDGKIACSLLTNDVMKKFNAESDYTDGISEYLRQIKTVEVSMLIKESDSQSCKVSLRSKRVDLCKVVAPFGGGGHMFASGCTIKKPAQIAKDKLVAEIKKYL